MTDNSPRNRCEIDKSARWGSSLSPVTGAAKLFAVDTACRRSSVRVYPDLGSVPK